MLATRAALAAGANSAVPLASMIASLSANATTLAASQDATVMAILDDNDAYTLSQNLATLLDEAVETHSSAETAFVDAVAAAVDAKAAAVVAEATVEAAAAHIDVAATVDVTGTAAPPPTPPRPSSSKNIAYISAVAVAAAGALIVADAAISLFLGLGLHWQLVGGGLRCIGQLTVLGALLGPIFRSKAPPLVAAYAAFMLVVGSSEAASRPAYSYRGMAKHVVCSLGAASTAFLGYSLAVAVRPRPWWDPQYSIPTLGLMLGNAISGVAVGLGALLEDFAANGDRIELLLCLGASGTALPSAPQSPPASSHGWFRASAAVGLAPGSGASRERTRSLAGAETRAQTGHLLPSRTDLRLPRLAAAAASAMAASVSWSSSKPSAAPLPLRAPPKGRLPTSSA